MAFCQWRRGLHFSNLTAVASIQPFMVNGTKQVPLPLSNVAFWWHTHPDVKVNGMVLGNSVPSQADFDFQAKMERSGYNNNTFIIGARSGTVSFYNKDKVIFTVKYTDFLKMGGK